MCSCASLFRGVAAPLGCVIPLLFLFFPLSLFSATHRTRSCPAALFDLHSVFICLGTLDRFAAASWRYFSGVYHLR